MSEQTNFEQKILDSLNKLPLPTPEILYWQMSQGLFIGFSDSKRTIKLKIKKYLNNQHNVVWARTPLNIGNIHQISVQASSMHYCYPRDNKGPYLEVEVGYPSFKLSKDFYQEYGKKSPYGFVNLNTIIKEIYKALPKLKQNGIKKK